VRTRRLPTTTSVRPCVRQPRSLQLNHAREDLLNTVAAREHQAGPVRTGLAARADATGNANPKFPYSTTFIQSRNKVGS
jgi:hypothetical protein